MLKEKKNKINKGKKALEIRQTRDSLYLDNYNRIFSSKKNMYKVR